MRGAKQVQMLWSPITFVAIVVLVSLRCISFVSYGIALRLDKVVFTRIKNVYIAFQVVKMGTLSSFSFLAGAGIIRSRLVYWDLPGAPPVCLKSPVTPSLCMRSMCLPALAKCEYSHNPYYLSLVPGRAFLPQAKAFFFRYKSNLPHAM